jgi:hypothetical protein
MYVISLKNEKIQYFLKKPDHFCKKSFISAKTNPYKKKGPLESAKANLKTMLWKFVV